MKLKHPGDKSHQESSSIKNGNNRKYEVMYGKYESVSFDVKPKTSTIIRCLDTKNFIAI